MGRLIGELRELLLDFVGRTSGVFFDWIGDAFRKIAELNFQELTLDQAFFLIGCLLVIVLGLYKLTTMARAQA